MSSKDQDRKPLFEIESLDHVAIRVADMDVSIEWYERVLGLEKKQFPEWGEFPVFMLSKQSGVAIFPANLQDSKIDQKSKNVKIDHFAFYVTNENFMRAQKKYEKLEITFEFQDHTHFHSIYTRDPDHHLVELTTRVT